MFRRREDYRCWVPVRVELPGEEEETFEARFLLLTAAEVAAFEDDEELMRAVWIGWRGVVGDAGEELPWSTEARDEIISMRWVFRPLVRAYAEVAGGVVRKN